MNAGKATWQLLRVSRWALWLAFLGYCFYVYAFREGQYNQFGHLPLQYRVDRYSGWRPLPFSPACWK